MIVVGVTGGLGTGKSAVTAMLGRLGARTISADALVHDALRRGTSTTRAIRRAFGPSVIAADGSVNRPVLAAVVFSDRRRLQRLCRIVHPVVIRRMRATIHRHRRRAPRGVVAVEIPLLVEAKLTHTVDVIVVVTATRAQQVSRVRHATGWPVAAIRRRMAAQLPLRVKVRAADVVIRNTGTWSQTQRQVRDLWKTLKAPPK